MAWCHTCDRLVEDDDAQGGACPTCGTQIIDSPSGPLPWKFRLMIVATAIYLAWRAWQLFTWLTH